MEKISYPKIKDMTPQEKLAKILRTDKNTVLDMEKKMFDLTQKSGIIGKIINENDEKVGEMLAFLNCPDYRAGSVFDALIRRVKEDDWILFEFFDKPSGTLAEDLKPMLDTALSLANIGPLFVLKKEKAEEILRKNPPPNIIKALNYKNIEELLKKEDLIEIFCALRFIESNEWMHNFFDKVYVKLTPNDFEKRKVDLRILSGKWLKIAEKFMEKKYHNVSHLKELGVIFIIPLKIDTPGETLRLFSLILHYLHEVDFYSNLFEMRAKATPLSNRASFGKSLIFLLKGEVLKVSRPFDGKIKWLIIQRYLAKDNPNDPRLFIPHANPEALHWKKAENDISRFGERVDGVSLKRWYELDWVGGFFKEEEDGESLISFDLVDNVMSLVKRGERAKYLYHQQEALWNKIFEEYMGINNLEKLIIENFDKGYISLSG